MRVVIYVWVNRVTDLNTCGCVVIDLNACEHVVISLMACGLVFDVWASRVCVLVCRD